MPNGSRFQFDVFISYSRQDRPAVAKLIARLRADGFQLWVDEEQISGGDPLREAMVKGILQSRHVICCLSPTYLASKWGTFESAVNQALDPDNRQRRLIPVQIASVTIPSEYRWLYCPDLTDPDTWEEEYQKTIKHLRSSAPEEEPLKRGTHLVDDAGHPNAGPSVSQVMVFPSPSPGLASLGFRYDPFAFPEAERMPPDVLEETFVAHPGFDQYIMDLTRSAVLVAPRGGGKTAGRLRLEIHLNQRRQRSFEGWPPEDGPPYAPLVVVYDTFEKLIERLPTVGLQDHTGPLLAAIAEALCCFILAYPGRFMALSIEARDWWWAFLGTYLEGGGPDSRVQGSPLGMDWKRTTVRPAPFRPGNALKRILEGVQRQLARLGVDSLFVLVDGVDGYLETQFVTNLETLVAPLLNTLSLLSLSGMVWKFFLPNDLEEAVLHSAGYETRRLNLAPINWDERSLVKLLRLRLEWASEGRIRYMAQLCDADLVRAVDVEQELVRMALQHRLGPPRGLLDLASKLLK